MIIRPSLEAELEINKLLDAEQDAKASSEYDMDHLAHKVEKEVQTHIEETADESQDDDVMSEDVDGTSEPVTDDVDASSESDGEIDDDSQDVGAPDGVPPSNEDQVSVESLRALEFPMVIATEAEFLTQGLSTISNAVRYAASHLYELGVTYGPSTASKVFKGVFYMMGRIASVLVSGIDILVKYIDRRLHSYQQLKSNIINLRSMLDDLEDSDMEIDGKFTKTDLIYQLSIQGQVDLQHNIQVLHDCISYVTKAVSEAISMDIDAIRHLVKFTEADTVKIPEHFMSLDDTTFGFKEGVVPGYQLDASSIESSYYGVIMPGNVVLMYYRPTGDLRDISEIREAYQNASMFLGHYMVRSRVPDTIPYVSKDELKTILDGLESLCDLCIAHQTTYKGILQKKQILKTTLKSYFMKLVNSPQRVSIRDSLLDYMQLKNVFIDKVYIAGMISLNDYISRNISNMLTYVEHNLKSLG